MKTLNGISMYVTKICNKKGGDFLIGATTLPKLRSNFKRIAGIDVHFNETNVHQVFIQPLGKAGEFNEL
jgi:hypothetical protein